MQETRQGSDVGGLVSEIVATGRREIAPRKPGFTLLEKPVIG